MKSWVVEYYKNGFYEEPKYNCLYAETAQEAAEQTEYDFAAYAVTAVFKEVHNWK